MSDANVQKEMLDTLTGLRQDVNHLKRDMHQLKEILEDTRLTNEEKEILDASITKARTGKKESFVSQEELKKELGL